MLRIDGTRLGCALALGIPPLEIVLGIAGTLLGVVGLILLATLESGPSDGILPVVLPTIFSCVTGLATFFHGVVKTRDNWFRGKLTVSLMANSRTLAVVRYRAPTLFFKYWYCVALKGNGCVIVTDIGQEIELHAHGRMGKRVVREFIRPLYASWWPRTSLEEVQKQLNQDILRLQAEYSPARPIITMLIAAALILVTALLCRHYLPIYATAISVIGAFTMLAVMGVFVIYFLFSLSRSQKRAQAVSVSLYEERPSRADGRIEEGNYVTH